MSKFKVGDRVSVERYYGAGWAPIENKFVCSGTLEVVKGTIVDERAGLFLVRLDKPTETHPGSTHAVATPRSLRKLIKKPRREWRGTWFKDRDGVGFYPAGSSDEFAPLDGQDMVLREVRHRK